jgi:hypothetical protein
MLHLWNLPIASIDVSDPLREDFYTTDVPQSGEYIIDTMRGTILAQAGRRKATRLAGHQGHGWGYPEPHLRCPRNARHINVCS